MSQGWSCPKCGAVFAPWVDSCRNCKGNAKPAPAPPSQPWTPPYPPYGTGKPIPPSPYVTTTTC